MNGVLFVDKLVGIILYDVVEFVRKVFNVKVGYVGIFDLFVIGFLVILLGEVIKFFFFFISQEKIYIVIM